MGGRTGDPEVLLLIGPRLSLHRLSQCILDHPVTVLHSVSLKLHEQFMLDAVNPR